MKGTSGIDKGPTSTAGGDGGAEGGAAQADEGDVHPACEDPDEDEICVKTSAGDVTIHDGRLWHRVKPSQRPSLRRSVYVPILTVDQPVEIKTVASSTPFYHYFGMTSVLMRRKEDTL